MNGAPDILPDPALAREPRYARLTEILRSIGGALVAFSGGVDSSLLAAAAKDALGERVLLVTARSPTYTEGESSQAASLAGALRMRHRFLDTRELEDPGFVRNDPDRCYHCKRELFARLADMAAAEGLGAVVDGFNRDDLGDYRPGHRAAQELGVRSPLCEAGLSKSDVRDLARLRGLPNWNAPARACLASRIPFGEAITPQRLTRVAAAEAALGGLGFSQWRVRDHGLLARVEVAPDQLERALSKDVRAAIVAACRAAGYTWIALDLEGYRTGSLNEALDRGDSAKP
jgi:uncharacterized protein